MDMRKVVIHLKNGDRLMSEVSDYKDYEDMVKQLGSLWGVWIFLGPNIVVRKSEISSINYVKEGYVQ